jgi:hypothetical protein
MMTLATLLEGIIPGELFAAIVLILIGSLSLRQGWVAYTEPIPRFVINYRGWTCPPLAMFHGGVAMLLMSLPAFKPPLHRIVAGVIGLTWLFCGLTSLLGLFFWFPRFLLPRWYRRAVKAGVPRNDPNAMGAFKALPLEQQREAAQRGNQR